VSKNTKQQACKMINYEDICMLNKIRGAGINIPIKATTKSKKKAHTREDSGLG
jgi:hypothetical protein